MVELPSSPAMKVATPSAGAPPTSGKQRFLTGSLPNRGRRVSSSNRRAFSKTSMILTMIFSTEISRAGIHSAVKKEVKG
jgi:hypothetical protein